MATLTTWASQDATHTSFLEAIENLDREYERIQKTLTEDLCPLNKDTYHLIVKLLKPKNRLERAICFHIFNIAYQAELLSQGAGVASFCFCIGFTKYLLRYHRDLLRKGNDFDLASQYESLSAGLQVQMKNMYKVANEARLITAINQATNHDEILTNVAFQAIKLGGLEGKVFVENGKQSNYLVELKEGFNFRAKPFKFFLKNNSTFWEESNCKVLILDGVIENVSEIDHLLMKTHETKIPLVVIAQGFSEEVVATLKANQERKNFDCIPVRIMPDLESLNVINDIGIVAGSIPVSSMKGDLLSFVKYDDLPLVDKVRCSQTDLVIENSTTKNQVNSQIKFLLEKRQSEQVNDIVDLLDKRLKSLVANTVTIYIPNISPLAIDDLRVKLDNALRAAKTILNYGIVDSQEAITAFASKLQDTSGLSKAFIAGFQNVCNLKDKNEWPTLSLMAVTSLAGKAMLMLLMSNGMVHFT